jgi:hypothetical protein
VPFVGCSAPTESDGAAIATVYMSGGSLKTVLEEKPE